ncbi:MAG: UDP-N-acetylmuramoyl-L-alanyl-D-glutamate--2,6-diaminopimelate ligase [bacterium]
MMRVRVYQQLKNVYHFCQAHWWQIYFGWPDRGIKIYGVTGTNGKTTTCYVLASILREAYGRDKVGMLTTVGIWIGEEESINETKMTTTDSKEVYRCLWRMRKKGVKHVVLEVTSHALDQNRLAGLQMEGAIILNIEREHLDYHKTMEEYGKAKARIADCVKVGSPVVVNKEFLISNLKFSLNLKFSKTRLIKFSAGEAEVVVTPLPGDFNKENVLAARLLARAVGVKEDAVARGVAAVKNVPGRMEWIDPQFSKGLPRVLIDYAVTPGSLERLYRYVRKETSGKIFAVLGAAGERDRGKRPLMAKAVAKYADEVVLTREDPWTENEEQIFKDLEQGLAPQSPEGEVGWRRIPDRREAIKYALEKAKDGDVVVVTGKGAETGMGVGKEIVSWNDREIIEELLALC